MKHSRKSILEAIGKWESILKRMNESQENVRQDALKAVYAWWDVCRKTHPDYYRYYSLSKVETPVVYKADGKLIIGVNAEVSTLLKGEEPTIKPPLEWIGVEKRYGGWEFDENTSEEIKADYTADRKENGKENLQRWEKITF